MAWFPAAVKTVVIVRPDVPHLAAQPTRWNPSADAFKACFEARGWRVKETSQTIPSRPDLIAGYGWKPVMRGAHQRWPEIVLHVDLGFWSRDKFMKLALGDRWSPLVDHDYDDSRLRMHGVKIEPNRKPGKRVLVCGMSAKAAGTWELQPEQWEQRTIKRLVVAGATVTYRPKPTWHQARPIKGAAEFDRGTDIKQALARVDAVVSHHSNAAIDALAAGLPIYVETGIAKSLSVATIEDAVGAEAPDLETRARFLRQVAFHQWTLTEIAEGTWLNPLAPLAGHPLFCGE